MGMPSQEYWDGEPRLVKAYREAYKIKQDEDNAKAWLQGMYNFIGVATALNNGFSNKKERYPDRPFDLHQAEKAQEEAPEDIRDRYYNRFKQMEELWKAQHERNNITDQNDL